MGKTAQNLRNVFGYCKGQKCVLMLDEIDYIGLARGRDTGVDGELGRTTIALMQALDELVDGQIVIAATNRQDHLDPALLRRFQRQTEFTPFDRDERIKMVARYMYDVNPALLTDELQTFAEEDHTQAELVKFMISKIAENIAKDS